MIHGVIRANGAYSEIGEYFFALEQQPDDPLLLLCIGVAYVNYAMGKSVVDKHYMVMRGFAFLYRYSELRNHNQVCQSFC